MPGNKPVNKKKTRWLSLCLAAVIMLAALPLNPMPANADRKTGLIVAGNSPLAVAVNPITNKIYAANNASNNVTVIDGADHSTAAVPAGTCPYAVAVNPATNKIYVANSDSNNVTVIDGATNTPATVPAGTSPWAVAVNPVTNKIYVANRDSANVTVIDGATNTTATVPVGTKPYAVAVNPATNKIYVANYGSANVTVIDGATNTPANVTAGTTPYAVAVNPVTNKIYVANRDSANVTVIDGATNTPTNVTAGTKPYAVAVNPVTNKIYVANYGNFNVTVIDGATNTSTNVMVGANPWAVAVNPATNKIYVANYGSSNVTVIDGADNSTANVWVGTSPFALAVNPATNKIYVAAYSNEVMVIDGADNSTANVTAGTNPYAAAVNPVTNKIYVANYDSANVTVIDGATNTTATVPAGISPCAVAVNPATNKIYVANYDSANVTVINGVDNSTVTVTAGTSPRAVAVNPAANKIYVANAGSANVTVINGADNSTATVTAGTSPYAVAINPATNKIYVANRGSANVTVIDGADNSTSAVPVGTTPCAVAVNPATNKIYVANKDSANVTVIDGADNSTAAVPVGTTPCAVAVNPATNKIYVVNRGSNNVTVIDGATNTAATVTAGTTPYAVAVNPATNKIYVANAVSNNITVIDGATNTAATVTAGTSPGDMAVNLATNKIYVANSASNNVTVIEEQAIQDIDPRVAIASLPGHVTTNPSPDFAFTTTSSNPLPVQQIWYQLDTMTGAWQKASPAGGSGAASLPPLALGTHVIYAMATDWQDATSLNTGSGSSPVTGKIAAYTFTVAAALSSANDILTFTLPEQTGAATINNVAHTVYMEVISGTNLSNLTPTITASAGATINPASGAAHDFTNPVTYTVTAQNGTPQTWTVTVTVAAALSSANDILTFTLPEQTGAATINNAAHTVNIEATNGTNLSNLTPTITVSGGAGINPVSGAAHDFTNPVAYTVTAQNGTPQTWTVTVTVAAALSSANDILTFTLPEQTGAATINNAAHTVYMEVTSGTALTNLTPTITVSAGADINPAAGTAQDFTNPVTYTVTAQDGTPQTWTVTVTAAASSNNADLSGLSLSQGVLTPAFAAGITSYSASVGNEVGAINITATLADSMASVKINDNPAVSGTAFPVNLNVGSNTITIKVTAQDTTTKTYRLTVTRASSSGTGGGGGGGSSYANNDGLQVGRAGRTISQDGITITFPSGAVEKDICVTVKKLAQDQGFNLPDGSLLLSRVIDITKDKSGSFQKPVTISISFDKTKLDPDKYDVAVWFYDEVAGKWMALENIKLDLKTGQVSGDALHFTRFAVIATPKTKREKPMEPVTLPPSKNIPGDIEGHWAKDNIMKLIAAGIIGGYPDGSFKPEQPVTRAEFTVMVVKALQLEVKEGKPFSDTASHWAKDSISAAAAYGIIGGYDEEHFGPNDLITREQAAIIIARAAKMEADTGGLNFTDSKAISSWAKVGVAAAVKGGFISGYPDNSFRPQEKTTRAQAAAMLVKLR